MSDLKGGLLASGDYHVETMPHLQFVQLGEHSPQHYETRLIDKFHITSFTFNSKSVLNFSTF